MGWLRRQANPKVMEAFQRSYAQAASAQLRGTKYVQRADVRDLRISAGSVVVRSKVDVVAVDVPEAAGVLLRLRAAVAAEAPPPALAAHMAMAMAAAGASSFPRMQE